MSVGGTWRAQTAEPARTVAKDAPDDPYGASEEPQTIGASAPPPPPASQSGGCCFLAAGRTVSGTRLPAGGHVLETRGAGGSARRARGIAWAESYRRASRSQPARLPSAERPLTVAFARVNPRAGAGTSGRPGRPAHRAHAAANLPRSEMHVQLAASAAHGETAQPRPLHASEAGTGQTRTREPRAFPVLQEEAGP